MELTDEVLKELAKSGTYYVDAALNNEEIKELAQALLDTRGAMKADDERLIKAAELAGEPYFGCDTAEHLADRLIEARQRVKDLEEALNERFSLTSTIQASELPDEPWAKEWLAARECAAELLKGETK